MDISKSDAVTPAPAGEKHESEIQHHEKARDEAFPKPIMRRDAHLDDEHVDLHWRSWVVVFVTCFAIMDQVFIVVAAGSVIAFIIRDLGEPGIAGWIIQVRKNEKG